MEASKGRPEWTIEATNITRFILAEALDLFGEQTGKNQALVESITLYRIILNERFREKFPLDWAMVQNSLGNALSKLGERESDKKHLREAITAYQEALKERTEERVPLDWAQTQRLLEMLS